MYTPPIPPSIESIQGSNARAMNEIVSIAGSEYQLAWLVDVSPETVADWVSKGQLPEEYIRPLLSRPGFSHLTPVDIRCDLQRMAQSIEASGPEDKPRREGRYSEEPSVGGSLLRRAEVLVRRDELIKKHNLGDWVRVKRDLYGVNWRNK